MPLQVAQDHGGAEPVGQAIEFLEDLGDDAGRRVGEGLRAMFGGDPLSSLPPRLGPGRPAGDPTGRAEEPGGNGRLPPDRSGLQGQHREGRLRGILGLVGVVENRLTGMQDHGAVAIDQRCKGFRLMVFGKLFE